MPRLRSRRAAIVTICSAATVGIAGMAAADAWQPRRAIEIVVPSAPGGGLDLAGRTLQGVVEQDKLSQKPLTVLNRPGGGGTVAIAYINTHAGDGHYAVVQALPLITNRLTGQSEIGLSDVTPLAQLLTEQVIFSVAADSPIKTPKELEGKKLAISPGNSHQILWPVFERLSGLKPNSVTWVTMDAASMPPSLIKGATDAVPFFVVHEARIRKIARQQNADIRVLSAWADLGFDLSSTSLVAREETIAKDPDGLKAFLRATLKGADYAFRNKHYDEGVGYVVKHHPEVDPDGALGAAQVASRFVYAEEVTSGKLAVGQFEPARLEKTRDTYTQYLELKRKVPLDELYTNDLLPEKK